MPSKSGDTSPSQIHWLFLGRGGSPPLLIRLSLVQFPAVQAVGGRPPQYAPASHVTLSFDFDLESGVWFTCDVGYLCANFSLPRPLCLRLRPDVRDRQTDVRQHHRLMPPRREHNNSGGRCSQVMPTRQQHPSPSLLICRPLHIPHPTRLTHLQLLQKVLTTTGCRRKR